MRLIVSLISNLKSVIAYRYIGKRQSATIRQPSGNQPIPQSRNPASRNPHRQSSINNTSNPDPQSLNPQSSISRYTT